MRFVAAGKFEPGDGVWRLAPLDADDAERLRRLAESRAYDGLPPTAAETVVRRVVDAVVDTMPRAAPTAASPRPQRSDAAPRAHRPDDAFSRRLQALVARHRGEPADLPQLVTLSLRVEADEEELVAGACRLVLQVHDEHDPLHVCDAAALWNDAPSVHGFGDRARTHASLALREAAAGLAAARAAARAAGPRRAGPRHRRPRQPARGRRRGAPRGGVDVLWPRSLGRDLKATATLDRAPGKREAQLVEGVLSGDALFAFNWQVALRGEPLTDAEMDALARASSPMLRLRGGWTVVDPAIARKARNRLIRTVKPAQAVAAALTGVVDIEDAPAEVVVGASLLKVREQLLDAATAPPLPTPAGPRGHAARLPAPGLHLARPPHLARPRRLPGRRHGARQDRHPDRAAPPPRRRPARSDPGGLPGLAARQLGGRDPALRARGRRTPLPRRAALARRPRARPTPSPTRASC